MITTPEFDDFNRADENPLSKGGEWSSTAVVEVPNNVTTNGPMKLAGGLARGNIGEDNASWYQAVALPSGDAQVWGEVNAGPGSAERIGIFTHLSDPTNAAGIDGYCGLFLNVPGVDNDPWAIWKVSNGAWTELDFVIQEGGPGGDDFLLLDRVGADLTFWWYQAATTTWFDMVSVTDSSFTGGYGGLYTRGDDAAFQGFGGGSPVQFVPQIIRYR